MLLEDNRRFADLLNLVIYDGEQVIDPEQLHNMDTAEMYASVKGAAESNVDIFDHAVLKSSSGIDFLLYDLTEVDYGMVAKVMAAISIGYSYQAMTLTEGRKLRPIIPFVVYRGKKEWDAPVTMQELSGNIPESRQVKTQDFSINLVLPRTFTAAQLNMLKSDLKQVLGAACLC